MAQAHIKGPVGPSKTDPDFRREAHVQQFAFQPGNDGAYMESNSFISYGKDGTILFLQCVLANIMGVYTHQPGFHIKFIDKEGKMTLHTEKFSNTEFKLSDEGASMSMNKDNNTFIYKKNEDGSKTYHVRIQHAASPLKCDVTFFQPADQESLMFGDSFVYFSEDKKSLFRMTYTMPRATVSGTVFKGKEAINFEGWGFVSHFGHNITPHHYSLKWQLFKLHTPEISLVMALLTCPKAMNYYQISHGYFVQGDSLEAATMDNTVTVPESSYDRDTGYNQPHSSVWTWKGKTKEGKDFVAEVHAPHKRLLDKVDVLGTLPWVIRIVIKAFLARPYHYQWLDQVTVKITIDGVTKEYSGEALHETTFVNPDS